MLKISKNNGMEIGKWNLDDIYPLDEFDTLCLELKTKLRNLLTIWGKITPEVSIEEFVEFFESKEQVISDAKKLISRIDLGFYEDQIDPTLKKLSSKANKLIVYVNEHIDDIDKWLTGITVKNKTTLDPENANRLIKSIPNFAYFINHKKEAYKHKLSGKEESIIDYKDETGLNSLLELRNQLISDYSFKLRTDKNVTKTLSQSDLISYAYDSNRQIREQAYKHLLTKYKNDINKHFLVYQSLVKDWTRESELRGYGSPISVRNFENDISGDTVNLLLNLACQKKEIFNPFFDKKAKQLGLNKLSRFDTHASVNKEETIISYDQAKELILDSFQSFSPKFYDYGKIVFEAQHIDFLPRANKQHGAFCETVCPEVTPYVFINYYNKVSDVFALAHEVGHAIHSMYTSSLYPSIQETNLPLSETASNLAEMMVFDHILSKETDPTIKASIVSQKITDTYSMTIKKMYLVKFEIRAFEYLKDGADPETLSQIYFDLQKEQYGEAVQVDPAFRYEWACIRHLFDAPFYCYAYNFGELLSYSIYSKFKSGKENIVPQIEKVLSSGNSKNPQDLLVELGMNINSEEFWLGGYKMIEDLVKKFAFNLR